MNKGMNERSDSPESQKPASNTKIVVVLAVILIAVAGASMYLLSKTDYSDREIFYHYMYKIQKVSNHEMSREQLYELHNFAEGAFFGNEDFRVGTGEVDLAKILRKRNIDVEFVSHPSVLPATKEDHRAKFERIKGEFMKKSPTKIPPDSEWAFIFRRRNDAFSDGICAWWNLIPAPPLKMWKKTEFVIRDCFMAESPLARKIFRAMHIHFDGFISKINDTWNNLRRK
ncbi:MAG: hypothetical protein LBJ16_02305 [Holosporaceae bacterium]|jgi:hypothetical protein|nr:hypothetical protein [Holosporaceae bacterium]